MNQDIIEKTYFDQLMVGHYIDAKYSEHEWKLAKIVEKDKRYAVISFEGVNSRDEQVFLNGHKTAPLRFWTEGYTGSTYRPYRPAPLPIPEYKNHLQVIQHTYLKEALPTAFTSTQYLRGELFVLVHSLLSREELREEQAAEALKFLIGFVEFVVKFGQKVLAFAAEYFQTSGTSKHSYLINQKSAYANCLNELLILLNFIVRAENSKHIAIFRSKIVNQDTLVNFFMDIRPEPLFQQLFHLNDSNGRWLSFNIHKHLYFLLKKYMPKFALPHYKLRDHAEVFSLYPFVIKQQQRNNNLEQPYVKFAIFCLKEQTSFQTKLKAIQELRKVLDGQIKLFRLEEKNVYSMIGQQGVIEHMLNEYHFNPEIFKRFTPVLQKYCKAKTLSMKSINSLFRLASNRHQSQVTVIFQIICLLAQFVQIDALDLMYAQILRYSPNQEQTIHLLKNFTINAILNYSRQKSFFASLFKKTKNSSKYGYYGLDLFFREIQDEGSITTNNIQLVFQTVRQIFTIEIFQHERMNYLGTCLGWLQKVRNYGQSLKLIDSILSTYPASAFFGDTRKDILQKLIQKHNLLHCVIYGLKHKLQINQHKLPLPTIQKHLFQLLENYYDIFAPFIKFEHIEFLWNNSEAKLLASFLKKPKVPPQEVTKKGYRQKYLKKIQQSVQEDILNKIVRKPQFYQRQLCYEQFQALDQIFMSFNILRKKLDISEMGMMRYFVPQMEGTHFYFQFLSKMALSPHIDKIVKKVILVFLRPKDEKEIDVKANTWKICLLKIVQKLKNHPETCLRAINCFFEMIQGKTVKLNVNFHSNIQIAVLNQTQQKMITLPRNNTIFKLRKQVMQQYNIPGNFTLYSVSLKRDITFAQQQQFSLNALNNHSNDKAPIIKITNKRKEKHPQMQALDKFKQTIEQEESFYTLLFSLNNQNNHDVFWRTVGKLPVNKQLIKRIQNCANFSKKQWQKLLKNQTDQSLQYHLNIIYQIMEKNYKWVALFFSSGGLDIILELLTSRLKDQQAIVQRIANRCVLILVCILDTVNRIEDKVLEELKLTLIAKIINTFRPPLQDVTIGIESLNNMFHLIVLINKTITTSTMDIQLPILLKILQYGVFKPKNKVTLQFIQQDFQNYLVNVYSKPEQKLKIYETLLNFLNPQLLNKKPSCQLLFTFLIDFMNTFVQNQFSQIDSEKYLDAIHQFVMDILKGSHEDPSKHKYHHLLYGCFKMLIYTLNKPKHKYVLEDLLKILLQDFFFNKNTKRIKNQVTFKLLYQATKKILFAEQNLIQILIKEVAPQLQHNLWRKNAYNSWILQSKQQERNIFCGLQNLGATCYINCLTQQLFMLPHFRQHFMSIDSKQYRQSPAQNQILQLQKIFAGMKYSNRRSVTSRKFCQSFITYQGVPINPMVQSDADQFYNQLMEKIQAFLKANGRHDIIQNTFEGMLSNQLNCQGCPHKSEKQEHFMSIGVNIRGKKTLEQALEGFVQGQILDGQNAYFCQPCQKKVRTQKRLCIKSLPNILTITIKRFEFNYDQMRKIKINSYLKFPQKLNMKNYTAQYLQNMPELPDEPYMYNLRGVVIHSGTSEGGHYYSFVFEDGKWFCFNDQFIEQTKYSRIEEDGFGGEDKSQEGDFKFQKFKNAYILLYEKQNPSESYHRQESITSPFSQEMQTSITVDNSNADFLSIMLDPNFIRLSQNFSVLQGESAYRFSFLYFHTVVLRDRNKQEHIPNYFRILDDLLKKQEISSWYLDQVNQQFIKEFIIEGPRTVRFISTSLVLRAIASVKEVPDNFIMHAISCLKKTGMTPFCTIFSKLAQREQCFSKLVQYEFPERAVSILMDKTNKNFKMLELKPFESYFGSDCSQKQKDGQAFQTSLCASLDRFDIPFAEALQILEKHSSRSGSKALAKLLARKVSEDQLGNLLLSMESTIMKDGEFKRQQVQKYLFVVRYCCLLEEENIQQRQQKCIYSLKKILYECRIYYEPMEAFLKQVNYIASRNGEFKSKWKSHMLDKDREKLYDPVKTLKYWLKEAQHPQYLLKSDQFKRKIASLSYDQKYDAESKNSAILYKRIAWMVEPDIDTTDNLDSDIEDPAVNREVTIRSKKFRLKQHLGLIKKVEVDGNEKWGILERNDFDLYQSL